MSFLFDGPVYPYNTGLKGCKRMQLFDGGGGEAYRSISISEIKISNICWHQSNFDIFLMDIPPKAKPGRNEFHLCLSQRGNDFIAD